MAMSFRIRGATADDIPALAQLHVVTFNETHCGGRSEGPSCALRERQWREAFAVVNDTADPTGLQIVVCDTTVYERGEHVSVHPGVIGSGARVIVWYRSVGERHPVADRVRILLE
jgi:hypothetical protein